MKNTRAIVGLLVVAAVAPSCGGGGAAPSKTVPQPIPIWQTQQRVPTTSDLRAVNFANFSTGLIGGKNGTLFRTDDGGTTWWQMDFLPAKRTGEISVIRGMNKLVVAAGIDEATGNGRLWISNDTLSWTTADVAATGTPYTDVTMSSVGIGPQFPVNYAALRQSGTVDVFPAGAAPYSAPSGTWSNAYGITQLGNGLGYVCGDNGGNGQIRKTIDSGANFTTDALPAGIGTLRKVFITPVSLRAFAVGEDNTVNHYGTLLTRDAPDQPWYIVPNLPATLPRLRSVHFPTGEYEGWVVGDGGTIYRINQVWDPIGMVWNWIWTNQNLAAITTKNLYTVNFVGNDNGWIVGDGPTILRTINGSAAVGPWWSDISQGVGGINWNAMSFSDDGLRGIAVGNGPASAAKIYRTIDGGANWTAMGLPAGLTNQTLYSVSVPRSNALGTTATICGELGKLYQNTDVWGLGTWTTPAWTGTSGNHTYRAVLFTNPGKGVLAGKDTVTTAPVLLYTNDGLNWNPAIGHTPPATPGQYNSLSVNPAGTAVFASGNGRVNMSTDLANGWTSWGDVTMTGLPAATFTVIQSPNDAFYTAMVAADNGSVYRLVAGGSWAAQTGSPWGAEIPVGLGYQGAVGGSLNGMVATSAGRIFSTIDGGVNWFQSYPHTKALARTLWMSPNQTGLGYAGCDDGVILRTESSGQ